MPVAIMPMKGPHVDECARLLDLLMEEVMDNRTEVLRECMNEEHFNCLVAIENEKVVGYADMFTQLDPGHGAFLGYLGNMVVAEGHRGKGIGKMLVQELARKARQIGAVELHVSTEFDNKKAQAFYEALGFTESSLFLEMDLE